MDDRTETGTTGQEELPSTRRILWLSRHQPIEPQLDSLKKHFGEIHVIQDETPFSSAEEIQKRYQEGRYDDMVIVATLSVLARLVDLGIHPLWAQMDIVDPKDADIIVGGRAYKFNRFKRVREIRIEFEELENKE